jgi:uncharacterized protein YeaO (DUF488 family)
LQRLAFSCELICTREKGPRTLTLVLHANRCKASSPVLSTSEVTVHEYFKITKDTVKHIFKLKRAREKSEPEDGARYLVDRLWPRGVSKVALKLNGWLKEVAPSDALRRWFHHDPEKWNEFRKRYFAELDANPDAWRPLAESANRGTVTLIYGARDTEHNNAVALAQYLRTKRHTKQQA